MKASKTARKADRRCIIYTVRRTQLFIEDQTLRKLKQLGAARKTTVSALVRAAIDKTYFQSKLPANWRQVLDEAFGLWNDRSDLPDAAAYVRRLRKDTRRKRLGR